MSSSTTNGTIKPLTLYGAQGPNPPKVAMILSLLKIPYETKQISLSEVKEPHYLAINPNGRIPSLYDPNTDLTIWESGAIVLYLISRYDTEHTLSFPQSSNEHAQTVQWLFFQTTGQGPYFGQALWFKKFHHEKLPSAVERYVTEVNRVTGVLEGWLEKQKGLYAGQDGPWLVGGKMTFADVAFVMWHRVVLLRFGKDEFDEDKYPLVKAWIAKIVAVEEIKRVLEA